MKSIDQDLQSAIHHYKNGHTLSLDEHNQSIPAKVGPRSALLKRMNSVPKMPLDVTYEVVQEEINRRVLHKTILERNPAAFRRYGYHDIFVIFSWWPCRTASATSCAKYASQKQAVRDLLTTLHPVSDPYDISPPKFGYNFTKRPRESQELRTGLEDFLLPQSQTIPRQTGYSRGHIRTVLELDTFGPNHSDSVSEGRSLGSLPLSPNVDRNAALSPSGSRRHSRSAGTHSPTDRSRSGLESRGSVEVLPQITPGGDMAGTVRLDLNRATFTSDDNAMPRIGTVSVWCDMIMLFLLPPPVLYSGSVTL